MSGAFERLPARAQACVCCALSLTLALVAWHTALAPAFQQLRATRERLAALRADEARASAAAAGLPDLRRQMETLERALRVRGASAEALVNEDTALRQVPALASAAGLPVQRFTPLPASQHERATRWPVEAAVRGNLAGIRRFLELVAEHPLLISVERFHLRATAGDAPGIDASCVIAFLQLGASS